MKKRHTFLLLILTVTAFVLVAGCTSPTQNNVAPSASVTPSTSTTASSAISRTPTASPSPSPSVVVTPSPSPTTPTSVPSVSPTGVPPTVPSTKTATAIDGNKFFDIDNTVARGSPITTWGFNVVAKGAQPHIVCIKEGRPLTALIDGRPAGTVTLQSGPDCFQTANYGLSAKETASLSVGTHTLTVRFAGDSTYQPSELVQKIEVA